MSILNFTPVDALVENLKVTGRLTDETKMKLWMAIKNLSDALVDIDTLESLETIQYLETPSGTVDGANKKFILTKVPSRDFIAGFKNGLLLKKGIDFVMKDNLITFSVAPAVASVIQFMYYY